MKNRVHMGPHTSSCLSRTVSHISMAIDQHTPLGFLILVVLVQPWLVSPLLVADAACPLCNSPQTQFGDFLTWGYSATVR